MIKNKAFSLIELIVVIAIVGILAAIAVPAYNSYVTKAKFLGVVTIANNLIDRSIAYSATHNRFGSAYDLGIGTQTFNQPNYGPVDEVHEAQIFGPYFAALGDVADVMLGETHYPACGALGTFYFHINKPSVGLPNDGNTIFVYCQYWHTAANTFERACGYMNVGNTEYLPGIWTNMAVDGFPSDNGAGVCQ